MNRERMQDIGLLVLRLTLGGLMLTHGIKKLLSFAEMSDSFADPIGVGPTFSLVLAVFAEVFCAGLVMLGAFTRFAVIPLIVTMAIAAFLVHAADPLAKKELALIYMAGFVALGFLGAGRLSLDAKLPERFRV